MDHEVFSDQHRNTFKYLIRFLKNNPISEINIAFITPRHGWPRQRARPALTGADTSQLTASAADRDRGAVTSETVRQLCDGAEWKNQWEVWLAKILKTAALVCLCLDLAGEASEFRVLCLNIMKVSW